MIIISVASTLVWPCSVRKREWEGVRFRSSRNPCNQSETLNGSSYQNLFMWWKWIWVFLSQLFHFVLSTWISRPPLNWFHIYFPTHTVRSYLVIVHQFLPCFWIFKIHDRPVFPRSTKTFWSDRWVTLGGALAPGGTEPLLGSARLGSAFSVSTCARNTCSSSGTEVRLVCFSVILVPDWQLDLSHAGWFMHLLDVDLMVLEASGS